MTPIVEFDADIVQGELIHVPEMYKDRLKDEESVHVVLMRKARKQTSRYRVIREMADHPLVFSDGKIPTRDEMHERH
jgi:hypothetical protein